MLAFSYYTYNKRNKYYDRNSFLETLKIPNLATIFYELFITLKRLPSIIEFYNLYVERNCNVHDNGTFNSWYMIGQALPSKESGSPKEINDI